MWDNEAWRRKEWGQKTERVPFLYTCSQSCLTLYNPKDCSPPNSLVQGIIEARILEWVAIISSGGSSWPREWTLISCVSCIDGGFFTVWAIGKPIHTHSVWIFMGFGCSCLSCFVISELKIKKQIWVECWLQHPTAQHLTSSELYFILVLQSFLLRVICIHIP